MKEFQEYDAGMSDNVLSYAPVMTLRPSRTATVAVWLGVVAHCLRLVFLVFYYLTRPRIVTSHTQVIQHFVWFKGVPALVVMAVAIVGFTLALIGLVRPDRLRRRAFIGLFLCMAAFGWWFV
jgi:uncharacterized membrane protein YkgB